MEPRVLSVILAAGEGTRMRSALPKVLHRLAGRPLVEHVLRAAMALGAGSRAVVVGPDMEAVAEVVSAVDPGARVFVQNERLGTAHAVLAAREALEEGADELLVLFGDTPFLTPETLGRLRGAVAGGAAVAVLGFRPPDPAGYGRLVVRNGMLEAIREERDASDDERAIGLCNAGVMAFGNAALGLIERIGCDNAKREYYLTDAVALARADGLDVAVIEADAQEVVGINNRAQLAEAEAILQRRLRDAAMAAGVTLTAPETVFLAADTVLGRDVIVEPHVVFGPGVTVEEGAVIHAFSHLEGAVIGRNASVGPFARLRPKARLGAKARVGNFVEVKAADIGDGAKVNHLTYIGDARIGPAANVGAGTITCNYDGFAKHRTEIGAGAFVGSNSALVAPVSIGDGAYVGSGSVVTEDVPADALAVARGRQVVKERWAADFRERMKAKGRKQD